MQYSVNVVLGLIEAEGFGEFSVISAVIFSIGVWLIKGVWHAHYKISITKGEFQFSWKKKVKTH